MQSLSTEAAGRLVARTAPLRQWEVERELRERLKTALDARGITTAPTVVAPGRPGHARPGRGGGREGVLTTGRPPVPWVSL